MLPPGESRWQDRQTDRRADVRPLHCAFRYGRSGRRNSERVHGWCTKLIDFRFDRFSIIVSVIGAVHLPGHLGIFAQCRMRLIGKWRMLQWSEIDVIAIRHSYIQTALALFASVTGMFTLCAEYYSDKITTLAATENVKLLLELSQRSINDVGSLWTPAS